MFNYQSSFFFPFLLSTNIQYTSILWQRKNFNQNGFAILLNQLILSRDKVVKFNFIKISIEMDWFVCENLHTSFAISIRDPVPEITLEQRKKNVLCILRFIIDLVKKTVFAFFPASNLY